MEPKQRKRKRVAEEVETTILTRRVKISMSVLGFKTPQHEAISPSPSLRLDNYVGSCATNGEEVHVGGVEATKEAPQPCDVDALRGQRPNVSGNHDINGAIFQECDQFLICGLWHHGDAQVGQDRRNDGSAACVHNTQESLSQPESPQRTGREGR